MNLPNVLCCFKNCFYGTGFHIKSPNMKKKPAISLDSTFIGSDVVILKEGSRICGTGGALCTAPLVQSKSYFEFKIQQAGRWAVGVATRKAELNKPLGLSDSESWVFTSDGCIRHNGSDLYSGLPILVEGDVVGITYDHVQVNIFLNGKTLDKSITGIRGHVYPAVYVDDGAVLDFIIDNFNYPSPNGFEQILIEQSLL